MSGKIPSLSERLYIRHIVPDIDSAIFFRMKDVIESGPGALLQGIELASTTSPAVTSIHPIK